MIQTMKRALRASPLAGPLRSLRSRYELHRLPDDAYRERRDDIAIRHVMARTLAPDACCIDVGANRGRILTMMMELAPRGQHIAVEPLPHLALDLHKRFPAVKVHCCALSDAPGQTTFHHVVTMNGWSGLKPPADGYPGQRTEQIPVQLQRLDDLVPADMTVRFIKIDTEGAELGVLRGGLKTIRRCRPVIVFEYSECHARPFGTTPEMLHDYLTVSCGLTVRSLLGRQASLGREQFIAVCKHATATNYDRGSQENFLATP